MEISFQGVLGTGLSSRAIAWFGGGMKFSHFDCVLPDGSLLGARSDDVGGGRGVRVRRPGYERWRRITRFTRPCTYAEQTLWVNFLMAQVGKPYDHVGIWDFITGQADDRNWREESAWFCDELALASCEKVGFPPLYIPTYRITPNSASVALTAWGFMARDMYVEN